MERIRQRWIHRAALVTILVGMNISSVTIARAAPKTCFLDIYGPPGLRSSAGVLGLLIADEFKSSGAKLVSRDILAKAIDDLEGPRPRYALVIQKAKRPALLRQVGAKFLIFGRLIRDGSRITARIHLVDSANAGKTKHVVATVPDGQLSALAHKVTVGLSKLMAIPVNPPPAQVATAPLLPYVLANEAQLARRPEKAAAAFRVAAFMGTAPSASAREIATWVARSSLDPSQKLLALIAGGKAKRATLKGSHLLAKGIASPKRSALLETLALAQLRAGDTRSATKTLRQIRGRHTDLTNLLRAAIAREKKAPGRRDTLLLKALGSKEGSLAALALIASWPSKELSPALLKKAFARVERERAPLANAFRSTIALRAAHQAKALHVDLDRSLRQIHPALLTRKQQEDLDTLLHGADAAGLKRAPTLQAEQALLRGDLDTAGRALTVALENDKLDFRANLLKARVLAQKGKKESSLPYYRVAVADGSIATKLEYAEALQATGRGAQGQALLLEISEAPESALSTAAAQASGPLGEIAARSLKLKGQDTTALEKSLALMLKAFRQIASESLDSIALSPLEPRAYEAIFPYALDNDVVTSTLKKLLKRQGIKVKTYVEPIHDLTIAELSSLVRRARTDAALIVDPRTSVLGQVALRLVLFDKETHKAFIVERKIDGRDLGIVKLRSIFAFLQFGLPALLLLWLAYALIRGTGTVRVSVHLDPAARQPTISVAIRRSRRAHPIRNPERYAQAMRVKGTKSRRSGGDMVAPTSTYPRIPCGKRYVHVTGTFKKDGVLQSIEGENIKELRVERGKTATVKFDFEPPSVKLTVTFLDGARPVPGIRVWLDSEDGRGALSNGRGEVTLLVPRRVRHWLNFQRDDFVRRRPISFEDTRDHHLQINIDRERLLAEADGGYEWQGTIEEASAGYKDQVLLASTDLDKAAENGEGLEDLVLASEISPTSGKGATNTTATVKPQNVDDERFIDILIDEEDGEESRSQALSSSDLGDTRSYGGGAPPDVAETNRSTQKQKSETQPQPAKPLAERPSSEAERAIASPLDRYENRRELGRGAMGVVFKAKDKILEREVAIKVLGEELLQYPLALKMFIQEAKALAALNHPNVVTVFDQGRDGDTVFMVMELVVGTTLEARIAEAEKLSLGEGLELCDQICSGLAYAHHRKIIHRDIKPENVMISEDGVAKIGDFGLARVLREISIQRTEIKGTPLYMSPEQIRGTDIDFRADIYSLGCTMYEMFTGQPPFTEGEILYHHIHTEPKSPDSLCPLPSPLNDLILKCIAKDKEARMPSVDAIRNVIKPLLKQFS